MRKTWCAVSALGLLLGLSGQLWSGEDAAARGVVAKAIEAQGGEARLAKYNAATMKGAGKFYGMSDEGVAFTGDWDVQGADQMRMRVLVKDKDMKFTFTTVVNGDKGWKKLNDDKANPMPKDVLAEERERMYCNWVATLVPLRGKGYKLAPLGEAKVEGNAAVGVRVSHAGHRDVSLYFDKKSSLLVKSQMTIKNVEDGSNKEMPQEILYRDYKDFSGARWPTKLTILQGGKRYVEVSFSEIRPAEKLNPSVFAEP
jgi:hypothetical protein